MGSNHYEQTVVFLLLILETPRIIVEELFYRDLQGVVRDDVAFAFISVYRLNRPFQFVVLLQSLTLVGVTSLWNYWIFHQFKCDFADQMIRNFQRLVYSPLPILDWSTNLDKYIFTNSSSFFFIFYLSLVLRINYFYALMAWAYLCSSFSQISFFNRNILMEIS
jgi:hypothetical protein